MIENKTISQIRTLTSIENEGHSSFGTLLEQVIHLINSRLVFSDVYIRQDSPVMLRLSAGLVAVSEALITKEKLEEFFEGIEPNWFERIQDRAFDCSIDLNVARIRVNCFTFQRKKHLGCVIRAFPKEPLELSKLGLRQCEQDFSKLKRGLVLIVGDAGQGKSTTIASMLDQINKTRSGHIITLEDPVETLIPQRKCFITQREIGFDGDVESYYLGAMDAMRMDFDVIVIGDIRDAQTAQETLALAESGRLVFATISARSIEVGLQKLLRLLGGGEALANVLEGVLCQALLPSVKGDRNYLVTECLTSSPKVARMIESGNISGIRGLMNSTDGQLNQGCHPMNAALILLLREKKINLEDARNATTDRISFDQESSYTVTTCIQSKHVTEDIFQFPFFYHMTHKDNLAGILRHGILSHKDVLVRDDILSHDISDPDVQKWRDNVEPVYHRKIHDYAPLYINPKNPMLRKRSDIQSEIVILKISAEVLQDGQHVFSDGNAASRDTKFSSNSGIVKNSLVVLNAKVWMDHVDGKRRRCAELLVYPKVQSVHILSIICSNNALAEEIAKETDLQIEVDTSKFF